MRSSAPAPFTSRRQNSSPPVLPRLSSATRLVNSTTTTTPNLCGSKAAAAVIEAVDGEADTTILQQHISQQPDGSTELKLLDTPYIPHMTQFTSEGRSYWQQLLHEDTSAAKTVSLELSPLYEDVFTHHNVDIAMAPEDMRVPATRAAVAAVDASNQALTRDAANANVPARLPQQTLATLTEKDVGSYSNPPSPIPLEANGAKEAEGGTSAPKFNAWLGQTRLGDSFPVLQEVANKLCRKSIEFNPYSRKADPKIPHEWDSNPVHTREPYNGCGQHGIWLHVPPDSIPKGLWELRPLPPLEDTMHRRCRYTPDTERALVELADANDTKLKKVVQEFGFYQQENECENDSEKGSSSKLETKSDARECDGHDARQETSGKARRGNLSAAEDDKGEAIGTVALHSQVAGVSLGDEEECSSKGLGTGGVRGEGAESSEECSEEEVTAVRGDKSAWAVPPLFWRERVSTWNNGNIWRDPRLTFKLKDKDWRARRAQYVVATHPAINGFEPAMPLAGSMVQQMMSSVAQAPMPLASFLLASLLQALWHEARKVPPSAWLQLQNYPLLLAT
jgi:hypothetical protein